MRQGIAAGVNAMTWAVAIVLVAQLSIGFAASPAIGVAVTRGSFQLDTAGVSGTGTIFDGSMVETGKATSELKLQSGVHMVLDSGTRGQIYRDHLLLEKGTGQLTNGANYRIRARSLQIEPVSEGAAKVTVSKEGNRVLVAALGGGVRVRSTRGVLLADVPAGRALSFEPQEGGASAPTELTGCLVKKNGHYYLTDETAGITVELQGQGLDKEVGKKVKIAGVVDHSGNPGNGGSQLVRVTQLSQLSNTRGCSATGATAAGAGGGSGAGAGAGAGAGTGAGMAVGTKAVIAGVVVAGAATGTAVGLTRDEKPPISQ